MTTMSITEKSERIIPQKNRDPYLLTPGPLTTSQTVKQAMLHDYGSRDRYFIDLNQKILNQLVNIVEGDSNYVAVPLQGSGTFVVEAMIGCFVPRKGKLLICVNGAYGQRIKKVCEYYDIEYVVLESNETTPTNCVELEETLVNDQTITHVAAVYCETTSGVLNPLKAISDTVNKYNRKLLIDAMSAFGALPLDCKIIEFDAVVASSNKCLQGVPGMGFCIAKQQALAKTQGNSRSLSLDLYDQWASMKQSKQWRFTPPTHVLLAFEQALTEFENEGGVGGRGKRYRENGSILVNGMRKLGFRPLLADEIQAPIIYTFAMPTDDRFNFDFFYEQLRQQGYVIYPGKLTVAESFRVGCIGHLDKTHMSGVLTAIKISLKKMGIDNFVN